MIMHLEAYVEQRRAAGNGVTPVDGGRTVVALNHIADAVMLLDDLEAAARELEKPHLLEALRVARGGLRRSWLALAHTYDWLPQEAPVGSEPGVSPFVPLPLLRQ
ncbi:MAG: hypothetical protein SWK90_12300 [Chloroflexota bacterium]|nr:hypothetical protein [Chloroflexota bacterium]